MPVPVHRQCVSPFSSRLPTHPIQGLNADGGKYPSSFSSCLSRLVCTVASRYYKEKPHIYAMAIHFAKAAAANAIIDGWKTVETCQAFTLWSLYNPPARRLEETRTWCYTGIAFRCVNPFSLGKRMW